MRERGGGFRLGIDHSSHWKIDGGGLGVGDCGGDCGGGLWGGTF